MHTKLYDCWRGSVLDHNQRLRTAAAQGNTSVIRYLLEDAPGGLDLEKSSSVTGWIPLMLPLGTAKWVKCLF